MRPLARRMIFVLDGMAVHVIDGPFAEAVKLELTCGGAHASTLLDKSRGAC